MDRENEYGSFSGGPGSFIADGPRKFTTHASNITSIQLSIPLYQSSDAMDFPSATTAFKP